MPTPNDVSINNYTSNNLFGFVTNNTWNCCDYPQAGSVVGFIKANTTFSLAICRTGGHGCNGDQGTFQLCLTSPNGMLFINLNLDGDGALGGIGQSWTYNSGVASGQLCVAQSSNTLIIWQVPSFVPPPDLWLTPRAPYGKEVDGLDILLPNEAVSDITVWGSAAQTTQYNCLAWAVGNTNAPALLGKDSEPTKAEVLAFMSQQGISEVPKFDETTVNIIGWGSPIDGLVRHFSVLMGFTNGSVSWSSKLGYKVNPENPAVGLLVSHSIDAPYGGPYYETLIFFHNPNGFIPLPE